MHKYHSFLLDFARKFRDEFLKFIEKYCKNPRAIEKIRKECRKFQFNDDVSILAFCLWSLNMIASFTHVLYPLGGPPNYNYEKKQGAILFPNSIDEIDVKKIYNLHRSLFYLVQSLAKNPRGKQDNETQ